MARYQITSKENLQRGFDKLTRNLGVMDRSESYKKAVMDKALSSIHYHVTKKFREPKTQVLVQTTELDPAGDYVWKWPRYSLQWLRDDWGGDPYLVPDGEDPDAVRSDPPGQRAMTPEPEPVRVRNRNQRPQRTGALLSGALGATSTASRSYVTASSTSSRPYNTSSRSSDLPPSSYASSLTADDDDEAHFSDGSDVTIKPSPRSRQREPTYVRTGSSPLRAHPRQTQPPYPDTASSSSRTSATTEIDSRLDRAEMRMRYVLNILKLMVPWKRDIDEWRTQEQITKINNLSPPAEDPGSDEPPYPNPPSTPPSCRNPPTGFTYESDITDFPHIPHHIAQFNPSNGRLLRSISTPPSPTTYYIPEDAEKTESQRLVALAMLYATVQVQHQVEASIARIAGDMNEQHRQECGARVAGAKRQEAAEQALQAVLVERDNGQESIQVPAMLQSLINGGGYDTT
ncbi:hypothetical protein H9Q72_009762 [Fusarium xylarioides]|uniref:Uncharacterized protein n=1 Tax=Fusarium xylarioides TaxID=221167 RepID=A0A9P7HM98_9HYPO|nr:hypothetical protein H9Q72_009762 [Fusarium xylarioides]